MGKFLENNILLIEDNPGDAELVMEGLSESKNDHIVHWVSDGAEALDFLQKKGKFKNVAMPTLILLDLNLPKKNGREVLETIKKDSKLQDIPVVILTSSRAHSDITQAYALNANAYIVKPVDLKHFMEAIKSIDRFWFDIVKLPFKSEVA